MKLGDAAHLAEIIGTAALVISLVFVGMQINDNTRELKAATSHNATIALQAWYLELGSNAQASSLFRQGMSDPTSMSKDESFQFLVSAHAIMITYQNAYYLGGSGALDQDMSKAMSSTLRASVAAPGFRWYWQQRGSHFTVEFRDYIDAVIVSADGQTAEIYR